MKYISSRGGETGLSFQQVLFSGYAKDGGLYFPEHVPNVTAETLESWAQLTYPDIVKKIMNIFIDSTEISSSHLDALVDRAFSCFPCASSPIQIAAFKDGLNIAELFHGPTLAFKDLALCVVGQLYEYFLSRAEKHMTVLIGTSGDTGSAAINAVKGLKWVDMVVLLPKGRCTQIQELQMTTVLEDNIYNFGVDGTSDDLDVPIKAVFADHEYVAEHSLCSINSINWARLLVQISHFFYCYFQTVSKVGDNVEIIVPTGACGNIASGFVAYKMGLPIQMVAAVTPNDIVDRTLKTGDFSLSEKVLQTWATAMDIQVPYNVERMVLMASDMNTSRVGELMKMFEQETQARLPADILSRIREVVVDSQVVPNSSMIGTMRRCYEENMYTLCPHTAVGVAYFYANNKQLPQVVLATAAPDKFPEAVSEAGLDPIENPSIQKLFSMPTRCEAMSQGEDWERILRNKIEEITSKHRKSL